MSWFEISDRVHFLCDHCGTDPSKQKAAQLHGANTRRAVIFGVVAGALAATLWYYIVVATGLEVGLVAAAVGWVTALGVLYSAGPWRGRPPQLLSVALTLASLVLADFLITRHVMLKYILERYGEPLALPPSLVIDAMVASVKSDPTLMGFWAIALISAFELPSRVRVTRPATPLTTA